MTIKRAFTVLQVKSLDEGERVIRGIATTPAADRMGDVVVPEGVKFQNPSPLLWQHQHDKPVGTVKFEKPTASGIQFEARIAKIDVPGVLKDRVDEAWQSVKAELVKAVSIGFRVLEDGYEVMKSGGLKFTKTEVVELSLVTIPANSQAVITAIKSLDTSIPAEGGAKDKEVPASSSGGSEGSIPVRKRAFKLTPRKYEKHQ